MMPFYLSSDPTVWLLALVVLVPLLFGIILFLLPAKKSLADILGTVAVFFSFFGALFLMTNFHPGPQGYAFLSTTPLGLESFGAQLQLGLNALSLPLFLLTGLVGAAAVLYLASHEFAQKNILWGCFLLIFGGTLGAFGSVDLFYSFFFHEIALLPTLLAFLFFGQGNIRQTVIEMGLFVLVGSLVTLAGLINFQISVGAHTFSLIEIHKQLQDMGLSAELHIPAWGIIFAGCLVLSGLWPFYTWVGKLLSQAPTPVAMIYGGALKFFGVYFLLQGFAGSTFYGLLQYKYVLSWLCVANIIFVGWAALYQTDLKKIIAYCAIMHIGTLFLALNSYTYEAIGGIVFLILGSGLATALLLMISGHIANRSEKLGINNISGLYQATPQMAAFLLMGFMAIIAIPCFVSFWGELGIIVGALRAGFISVLAILAGIMIATCVGLRTLNNILLGARQAMDIPDLSRAEILSAWVLVFPLIIFALFPNAIASPLNALMHTIVPFKL